MSAKLVKALSLLINIKQKACIKEEHPVRQQQSVLPRTANTISIPMFTGKPKRSPTLSVASVEDEVYEEMSDSGA